MYSDRVKTYTLKDEKPHALRDNKNTPGQYDTWVLNLNRARAFITGRSTSKSTNSKRWCKIGVETIRTESRGGRWEVLQ